MSAPKNNGSIAVLNHTQYQDHIPIYGPADSIVNFLKDGYRGEIYYLQHSLYPGDGSMLTRYFDGKEEVVRRCQFHRRWNNILRYKIDWVLSLKLLLPCKNLSLIIATDPLNFLYGFFLKKIKDVNKIIFFTVDYGYQRFTNPLLNWVYHALDRFACRHADSLWNTSRKITEVRIRQGAPSEKNEYIPNSPISEGVKVKSLGEIERYTLVMVFSNYLQVDFKIVFEALKALAVEFPQIKIKLIGRGDFEVPVKDELKDKALLKHIEFLDTHTHCETLEELSRCAVGLECNTQQLAWNEFREPIKLREYLFFGLPVISKPGHSLEEEIIEEKVGFIVKNSGELAEAVRRFFNDGDFYSATRERALKLAEKYNKAKILSAAFNKLGLVIK